MPGGAPNLTGMDRLRIDEDYERRGLDTLSDAHLVDLASSILAEPLASEATANSFVLHAPLELLARADLLTNVKPACRRVARLRIASLVAGYEESGERISHPRAPSVLALRQVAVGLRNAIAAGNLDDVDRLAAHLADHASATSISLLLAEDVLGHLGAAGHANIYLDLARGSRLGRLGPRLLRPVVRELAKAPRRTMTAALSSAGVRHTNGEGVVSALSRLPSVGPPQAFGIAPMVERAEAEGVVPEFLRRVNATIAADSAQAGRDLLRCAALMMLQGPGEHAPYGWTHCLTLSQAAHAQGHDVPDPAQATAVAAAYVVAHWTCLAKSAFDPDWEPPHVGTSFADAVESGPKVAAGAAWHASEAEPSDIRERLASMASAAHDAHHVKYTVACLRAEAIDPQARRLFLAAAAYLSGWWIAHPDQNDPLYPRSAKE